MDRYGRQGRDSIVFDYGHDCPTHEAAVPSLEPEELLHGRPPPRYGRPVDCQLRIQDEYARVPMYLEEEDIYEEVRRRNHRHPSAGFSGQNRYHDGVSPQDFVIPDRRASHEFTRQALHLGDPGLDHLIRRDAFVHSSFQPPAWDSVRRSEDWGTTARPHDHDREWSPSDSVRSHESVRECHDLFRSHGTSADWHRSVRNHDGERDTVRGHDLAREWDAGVRGHDITRGGDGLVRSRDIERDWENPARMSNRLIPNHSSTPQEVGVSFSSNDRRPVQGLDSSISRLGDLFTAEELVTLQKFVGDVKKLPGRHTPSQSISEAAPRMESSPHHNLSSEAPVFRCKFDGSDGHRDLPSKIRSVDEHEFPNKFSASNDSHYDLPSKFRSVDEHAFPNKFSASNDSHYDLPSKFRSVDEHEFPDKFSARDRGDMESRGPAGGPFVGRREMHAQLQDTLPEFGQKRRGDFGPLSEEMRPCGPKQPRRAGSLLDLKLDWRDLANPPDVEGLFDDGMDQAPAQNSTSDNRVDLKSMFREKKLQRFIEFFRRRPQDEDSDGTALQAAVLQSGIKWALAVEKEVVGECSANCQMVSAKIRLGQVFLARVVGIGKAAVRRKCHSMAVQRLRSMDARQILALTDVGLPAVSDMLEEVKRSVDTQRGSEWPTFIAVLKVYDPDKVDVISRIEKAVSQSQCGLERAFSMSVETVKGRKIFTGSLRIGGLLQGQDKSPNRKQCKVMTYHNAYKRFMELELSEILKGATPLSRDNKDKSNAFHIDIQPIDSEARVGKLEIFLQKIRMYTVKEGPSSQLGKVGYLCHLPVISVLRLLEPTSPIYTCQVFLADLLLGSATGRMRDAEVQAFGKALQRVMEASVDDLLAETCRLKPGDLEADSVVEVCVKGERKKVESNIGTLSLTQARFVSAKEDWRGRMVVVETKEMNTKDRKMLASVVLYKSALMSGLVLKYCLESEAGLYVCRVQLQSEVLGMAKGYSWTVAKNLASADALFKLYQTQPVLKAFCRTPSADWVTRDQLMERLNSSSFDASEEDWLQEFCQKHTVEEGQEPPQHHTEDTSVFGRLALVVSRLVREFVERGEPLDELVLAPEVCRFARVGVALCKEDLAIHITYPNKDTKHLSVSLPMAPLEVMARMKALGVTQTRRYQLVEDRAFLPCYADIAAEIRASQALSSPPSKHQQSGELPFEDEHGDHDGQAARPGAAIRQTPDNKGQKVKASLAHVIKTESNKKQILLEKFAQVLSKAGIGQVLQLDCDQDDDL